MIGAPLVAACCNVLGPLQDSDVPGMMDPFWNSSTKPSASSGPSSTSTIASKLHNCGLSAKREKFFCHLLKDGLTYRQDKRPSAFSLFQRTVQEMTDVERNMMPKLSAKEKEEAARKCGGEEKAKEIFKSLYNTA